MAAQAVVAANVDGKITKHFPPVQKTVAEEAESRLMKATANFVCVPGMSRNILYQPEYKELLEAFANASKEKCVPKTLFSKETPGDAVKKRFDDVYKLVLANTRGEGKFVCLSHDGSTMLNKRKEINILLIDVHDGSAVFWDTVTLRFRHNADALRDAIVPVIEALMREGIHVVGMVTDNESTQKAANTKIVARFPWLQTTGDGAHITQLMFAHIARHPDVAPIVRWLDTVSKAFDRIELWTALLRTQLETLGLGVEDAAKAKKPHVRCNTRFSDAQRTIESLIKLKSYIVQVADHHDIGAQVGVEQWNALTDLLILIAPLGMVTNLLQRDTTTIWESWLAWQVCWY